MSKGKVVVIGSNATRIEVQGGGTGATGQYLNETVVPAMAFIDAGYDVLLATPHIDDASDSAQHFRGDEVAYQRGRAFFADHPSMNQGRTLRSVIDEGLENYAAIFVPGGQAPVVDLMQDAEVGEIVRHFHAHKKPSAFLCHGPMASVAAMPNAREFRAALIAGNKARASKLAAGGDVSITSIDFEPYVIEDRELITGQNPRSDNLIAEKLIQALERRTVTT